MSHKAFRVISVVLLVALMMSVFAVSGLAACRSKVIRGNDVEFGVRTPNKVRNLWTKTHMTVKNTGTHDIYIYIPMIGCTGRRLGRNQTADFYLSGKNKCYGITIQRATTFGGQDSAMVWIENPGTVW